MMGRSEVWYFAHVVGPVDGTLILCGVLYPAIPCVSKVVVAPYDRAGRRGYLEHRGIGLKVERGRDERCCARGLVHRKVVLDIQRYARLPSERDIIGLTVSGRDDYAKGLHAVIVDEENIVALFPMIADMDKCSVVDDAYALDNLLNRKVAAF